MATSKSTKIQGEIDKARAKLSEQQARLRELEQKHKETENEEIADIVRGISIPLDKLPVLLQKLKGGGVDGPAPPLDKMSRSPRPRERRKPMRNKKTTRAVALLLCVCCRCPFLLGMTATASTLGDSGQREGCLITCHCTVRCSENMKNPDCPGCQENLTMCIGKPFSCICTEKCTEEKRGGDCPACALAIWLCTGNEPAPAPAGSYAITIVAPSGWHTRTAKVEVRVTDENDTGWKKVETKIERNGNPEDLTDAFAGGGRVYVTISENCTCMSR